MPHKLKDTLSRLPPVYAAILVLGATLASGWAGRGWLGDQVAIPNAVQVNTQSIDALAARVNKLVTSQTRLTRRVDVMICLLDAERKNLPAFTCSR